MQSPEEEFSAFSVLYFSSIFIILKHTYCACVPAIVLSTGTKFVNKEEIVSGTRSEDSVNLRLSSPRVFTMKMYSNLCFNVFAFFICKKRMFYEG